MNEASHHVLDLLPTPEGVPSRRTSVRMDLPSRGRSVSVKAKAQHCLIRPYNSTFVHTIFSVALNTTIENKRRVDSSVAATT